MSAAPRAIPPRVLCDESDSIGSAKLAPLDCTFNSYCLRRAVNLWAALIIKTRGTRARGSFPNEYQ